MRKTYPRAPWRMIVVVVGLVLASEVVGALSIQRNDVDPGLVFAIGFLPGVVATVLMVFYHRRRARRGHGK